MTRTRGARNADHAERRAELLARLRRRLAARELGQASLRELAAAAEVTVPTLKHHFGGRNEVVAAVLDHAGAAGAPHLQAGATPSGPLDRSVRAFLAYAAMGHRHGVGDLHAIGLTEGIGHGVLGPRYVSVILEPTLQALEARLAAHVAAGEMRDANLRHAALALLAPLLLAQLHQDELGGAACRPLDLDAFLEDHAAAFVRAYRLES